VVLGLRLSPLLREGDAQFSHPAGDLNGVFKMEQAAGIDRCGLLYGEPPCLALQDQDSGLPCCMQ
jgi:hypothetical protein